MANRFHSMSMFFCKGWVKGKDASRDHEYFFSVQGYKEFLGKPFNSMQLFVCSKDEYDSSK